MKSVLHAQSVDSRRRTIVARVLRLRPSARYGFAVAVTALGTWLRLLLSDEWAAEIPFITFYPAVMSAAWIGGLSPGLLATVLSAVAANYLWVAPPASFALGESSDAAALLVFVTTGTIISALNEAWRRAAAAVAQSEDRERQARQEAEHANRVKDEFLAVLSHELRTPLNATLGWAQLLASGSVAPDRVRDAATTIERNARAEARLVESLLDLSRIVAGTFELELKPIDLSSVVRSTVEALRPTARDVVLTVDIPDEPIAIRGDATRLQQVVWNMLANAIKFTPREGGITVQLRRCGSTAQIQVSDTGQGIPAEFLPHVFERFRQGDGTTARVRRGLGLGLALVREFTEAHGGSVSATSQGIGRGSTFTVTLPIQAEGETQSRPDKAHQETADSPSLTGVRVLVVDDDADARDLLVTLLQSRGAVVCTASSALEALDVIGQFRPQVLLADIGLPHEDGLNLIRKVRAREREQGALSMPAIAVTAYGGADHRVETIAAGYDVHLAKPFQPLELAQTVSQLASSRASRSTSPVVESMRRRAYDEQSV
jgi:signal transduction histidine kinase/FixJ family two-component response regulator